MTTPTPMICGKCSKPIALGETGLRHFGSSTAHSESRCIELLKADLAAAQEWRETVLNELIVAHIYTKEHDTNPRKAIQDAITWNCQVALDPAVSSDARALIANELRAVAAAQEELASVKAHAEAMAVTLDSWARLDGGCKCAALDAYRAAHPKEGT